MTNQDERGVSRRGVMAAAGVGAAALAGLPRSTSAANRELTASEKRNLENVNALLALFGNPECTPEKLAAYLSDDCFLRVNAGKPPATGKEEAKSVFEEFLTGGQRIGIKVHENFVRGPLIANDRLDWVIDSSGKRGAEFGAVGVFVMADDGRIQEWADFVLSS